MMNASVKLNSSNGVTRRMRLLWPCLLLATTLSAQGVCEPESDLFTNATMQTFWRFHDPVGDGTLTMTGSTAEIAVPAGVVHNL